VDKAIKDVEKRRLDDARKAAAKTAAEYGFRLADLVDSKADTNGKSKLPPKYRHPENPDQTWTGRGRRPAWLEEALASGHALEEFKID
jgi:DNA-binding protein H-NS